MRIRFRLHVSGLRSLVGTPTTISTSRRIKPRAATVFRESSTRKRRATRPITDITIGERVRKDMGDIADLAESIKKIGLLNAVVITSDGTLVAGARRLAACRWLGWKTIPVTILDDKIGVKSA